MLKKLDNFMTEIQCDDLVDDIFRPGWECVILANFLQQWKALILEYGEEKILENLSVALDKLVTNSDFETAYMMIKRFQEDLNLLKFREHYPDEEKERLRKFGWNI